MRRRSDIDGIITTNRATSNKTDLTELSINNP